MIPSFLADLKETPARLAERRQALSRKARSARASSQERLWRAQTDALERVEGWLHDTPRVPVLGALASAAERLVDRRLDVLTAVPVADYDSLNARDASRAVRGLEDRVSVLVVARHEAANKNRKTVLRAVEEQLERLERAAGPAPAAPAEPAPAPPAEPAPAPPAEPAPA